MATRKIVINKSYGEFCLSHKAFVLLRELGQRDALEEEDSGRYWPSGARPDDPGLNRFGMRIPRDDLKLVQVVEKLRAEANGHAAELMIVEIPNDVQWKIEKSSGGTEHVSEAHRQWS